MSAPATECARGLALAREAARRIAGVVYRTPLERSSFLSSVAGCDVLLKLECWQRTRSFKLRGAYNAIASLPVAQRSRGVVTASAGNHGLGVALAAQELGVAATIFVPADAPAVKQQRIVRLGAVLQRQAADYDAAEALARRYAEETGAAFVHAFSDPAVVSGQGTVAVEIIEEAPGIRELLLPVGGGGLIAGAGAAARGALPGVRVIGAQSVETRAMYESFRAGRAVDVVVTPTYADGLAGCTDEVAYRMARDVVDDIVLVEEHDIASAIRALYMHDGVVAEGAAAVAVAAVLSGRVVLRGPAAVVVTGGNIDAAVLAGILQQVDT